MPSLRGAVARVADLGGRRIERRRGPGVGARDLGLRDRDRFTNGAASQVVPTAVDEEVVEERADDAGVVAVLESGPRRGADRGSARLVVEQPDEDFGRRGSRRRGARRSPPRPR